MSKDTGGPALPTPHYTNANGEVQWGADGMSLRDYFAAKALPGLMRRNWSNHNGTDEELIDLWARSSYSIADAMLKAREA